MRDGITCVVHPDTGRLIPARELTPEEWRRLVAMEAAARHEADTFDVSQERTEKT